VPSDEGETLDEIHAELTIMRQEIAELHALLGPGAEAADDESDRPPE